MVIVNQMKNYGLDENEKRLRFETRLKMKVIPDPDPGSIDCLVWYQSFPVGPICELSKRYPPFSVHPRFFGSFLVHVRVNLKRTGQER
jgi:hypothetical protein